MKLTALILFALPLFAATTVTTTATQAVISYVAPDATACTMDVRESGAASVVHDVDATLFTGANLDSRSTSVNSGTSRTVVIGKRAAEFASDNRRYSRALQAYTLHTFDMTCAGAVHITGSFTTMNPPIGQTYADPLPVDPSNPGQYAWPSFSWTDRTEKIVDPQTGILLKLMDSPRDAYESFGSGVFETPIGTNWTSPGNVVADDSSAATYTAATQDWLFMPLGVTRFASKSINSPTVNSINPTFNAWAAASATLDVALTVDGVNPVGDILTHALASCSSSCTAGNRFTMPTSPTPGLAEWFASTGGLSSIDLSDLAKRTGTVNRTTTAVTYIDGDRFNLKWTNGSKITINGTVYTIASVNHDMSITLTTGSGSDSAVAYSASNAGFLVRNHNTSGTISIQYASYAYEISDLATSGSTGDEDWTANCAPVAVVGPASEVGKHCTASGTIYWVGDTTGTRNRLGRLVPTFNGGSPGWNSGVASYSYWDWTDPNSLYIQIGDNSTARHETYVLKFTYTGSNADIGDLQAQTPVVACGSAPCWTITRITSTPIETQVAAFMSTLWTAQKFDSNTVQMMGRMPTTNALTFMLRRDGNNNSLCYFAKLDIASGLVTAAIAPHAVWPSRWSGCHGPFNASDPTWMLIPSTPLRGGFTGTPTDAGSGPYYSTVTSGSISSTGTACPARPGGSPIAVADWPSGNNCLTITVDGEPGDPTPAQLSAASGRQGAGTVTTSGTSVIGTGSAWEIWSDQRQMKIGSTYCRFTFIDGTHGTLSACSASTPVVTNSAYTMYMEEVNSSSLGNAGFGWLQNAAVRDLFCLSATASGNLCPVTAINSVYYPSGNEILRLLTKSGGGQGQTWVLQRGYAKGQTQTAFSSVAASSILIAIPSSCNFDATYPCSEARTEWDTTDTLGANAGGTTVMIDTTDTGAGHGTHQNGANVDGSQIQPSRDGSSSGYFVRNSGLPSVFTDTGYYTANNPPFRSKVGVGYPNTVDSHPSHNQYSGVASTNELSWFADSRVFLGGDTSGPGDLTGSAASPGTLVAGTLYKFSAAQTTRLRPKLFGTLATCGAMPLDEISGPSSHLLSTSGDNYKYCIANAIGECRGGGDTGGTSAVGDLFVNCPQIRLPYCSWPGVGNEDPDTRDICIADMGAYSLSVSQMGVAKADPDGALGRRVTAIGQYKKVNPFWSTHVLPDGRSLFYWAPWVNGTRSSILLAKLPPWPGGDSINRGDFIPIVVKVPSGTGANNAIVQYGYNPSLFCTSRQEACVSGSATLADPVWASEAPAGVACSSGCTITIPAISQRVLYFRLVLRDGSNVAIRTDPVAVRAVR